MTTKSEMVSKRRHQTQTSTLRPRQHQARVQRRNDLDLRRPATKIEATTTKNLAAILIRIPKAMAMKRMAMIEKHAHGRTRKKAFDMISLVVLAIFCTSVLATTSAATGTFDQPGCVLVEAALVAKAAAMNSTCFDVTKSCVQCTNSPQCAFCPNVNIDVSGVLLGVNYNFQCTPAVLTFVLLVLFRFVSFCSGESVSLKIYVSSSFF